LQPPLSVLDLSPILEGGDAVQAFQIIEWFEKNGAAALSPEAPRQ